uniref:Uncharacterized protein n=1 Tax=Setaria italica TaxID=4555 RepID=K3XUG5_SETIT
MVMDEWMAEENPIPGYILCSVLAAQHKVLKSVFSS